MPNSRDKYPKLSTRRKFAIQYANDCRLYEVKEDGLLHEPAKIKLPPRKPEDSAKTLVDVGFLVKTGKGSPWRFADRVRHGKTYREYPYLSENTVQGDE